jgi:hypothetical protein
MPGKGNCSPIHLSAQNKLGEPACDHKGSERDGADCDDDGAQLDDAVGFQSSFRSSAA